jgi:hypothetical protein
MYKALKAAQNDIHTTLLKFTDDIVQLRESNGDSNTLANAVQLLHAKQDVQFRVLNGAIENLNENMSKIVTLLSDRSTNAVVTTDSTIPSLQPRATTTEMNDVVTMASMPVPIVVPSSLVKTVSVPLVESTVPVDDSLSEIEVDDTEEVEIEEEVEEEVEDEEDLEVEEWTYKGRTFFKDTQNTVYANDSGEVGDAIGTYDPVKNILKKLN